MSKKRKLSYSAEEEAHQQCRGTGYLLQDLLSSTIILARINLTNCQTKSHPLQVQDSQSTSITLTQEGSESCSICGARSAKCQPFTQKEMEIMGEFILKPFLISIAAAENLGTMFHWLCLGCYGTLEKLVNLKKEMDVITTCLRALVRIQLKKNASLTSLPEKLPESEQEEEERSSSLLNNDDNYGSDNSLQARPNCMNGELDEDPIIRTLPNLPLIEENQVITEERPEEESGEDRLNANENEDIDAYGRSRMPDIYPSPSGSNVNSTIVHQKNVHKRVNRNRKRRLRVELVDPLAPSPEKLDTQQNRKSMKKVRMSHHNNNKFIGGTGGRVKCVVCMLNYSGDYSLDRHLQSKLHKEGAKSRKVNAKGATTFACDMCPEEFTLLAELVFHKKSLHKNTPASQEVIGGQSGGNNEHFEIKIDPNEEEDDDEEMKPVVLNTEFDIMDDHQPENLVEFYQASDQLPSAIMDDEGQDLESNDHPPDDAPDEVVDTRNNSTKDHPRSEEGCEIMEEVRTKRKSRAKAEELLHTLMSKNGDEDEDDEEESDANIDEEEEESAGSSYVGDLEGEEDLNQESKFCCEPCKKEFATSRSLSHHLLTDSHAIQVGGEEALTELEKKKRFQCSVCEKKFMFPRILRQHEKDKHKMNVPIIRPLQGKGDRLKICKPCNKEFTRAGDLRRHLLSDSHAIKVRGGEDAAEKKKTVAEAVERIKCNIWQLNFGKSDVDNHTASKAHTLGERTRRDKDDGSGVIFACDQCDESFPLVLTLGQHIQETHRKWGGRGMDNKICWPCNKEFTMATYLRCHLLMGSHVKQVGGEDALAELRKQKLAIDPLECIVCGEKCLDFEALKLHGSQHPKNKCDICDRKFTWEQTYHKHFSSNSHKMAIKARQRDANGTITFSCQECDQSFGTVKNLATHVTRIHSQEAIKKRESFQAPRCDVCDKTFSFTFQLKDHLRSKNHVLKVGGEEGLEELEKQKTVQCDECDRRYFTSKLLKQHKISSHEPEPSICDVCGKQLRTAKSLERHLSLCHSETPKPIVVPKKPNMLKAPLSKRYSCKRCGRRFTDREVMKRHVKVIHEGHREKCDLCQKEYAGHEALKRHKMLTHGQGELKVKNRTATKRLKYSCQVCSRMIVGQTNLTRHIELKHYPDKGNCPFGCPDKIGSEEEWIAHLEQCKSEKMTEECKCYCFFCGDVFSNQLLRIAHHLRIHKTYPCEFCPRTFTRNDILPHHIFEHEEAKPWLCTKCGKRFRQQWNLNIHSTTVCGDDEAAKEALIAKRRELHRIYREKAKPHKCNQCSKAFVEERRLEYHTNKAHQGQGKKKAKKKCRSRTNDEEEDDVSTTSEDESEEDDAE